MGKYSNLEDNIEKDIELVLDELYKLTEKEFNGIKLTKDKSKNYVEMVDYLRDNSVEIHFEIKY